MPPASAYEPKSEDTPPIDYSNECWLGPASPFSLESYPTQYQLDLMNGWWGTYREGVPPCSDEPAAVGVSPVYSRTHSETFSATYSAQKESSSLTIWEASAQNDTRLQFQTRQTELRGDRDNRLSDLEPYTELHSPSDPPSSSQMPGGEKRFSSDRAGELTSPTSSKGDYDGKRRTQNREAQRAFRARQRSHMQFLEERLQDLTSRHMRLKKEYLELDAKYHTLLKDPQRRDSDYEDDLDTPEAGDGAPLE